MAVRTFRLQKVKKKKATHNLHIYQQIIQMDRAFVAEMVHSVLITGHRHRFLVEENKFRGGERVGVRIFSL